MDVEDMLEYGGRVSTTEERSGQGRTRYGEGRTWLFGERKSLRFKFDIVLGVAEFESLSPCTWTWNVNRTWPTLLHPDYFSRDNCGTKDCSVKLTSQKLDLGD